MGARKQMTKRMTAADYERTDADKKADAKSGAKEGSKADMKQDKAGLAAMNKKSLPWSSPAPKKGGKKK